MRGALLMCLLAVAGCSWSPWDSGDGDRDGDGLTDAEEAVLGTDPDRADSDGDGQTDFAEVRRYKTDPLKIDTDGDGVPDGAEIAEKKSDPLVPDHEPAPPPPAAEAPPPTGPRPRYDGSAAAPPERARCPKGRLDAYGCYVEIPGGTFKMGSQSTDPSAPGYDAQAYVDEAPPHDTTVSTFWILSTEVSASSFGSCVESGWCSEADVDGGGGFSNYAKLASAPRTPHPINAITWEGARKMCAWLGGRLPTEAEWEYAARGSEGRRFPWGSEEACGLRAAASGVATKQGERRDAQMLPPCDGGGTLSPALLAGPTPQGVHGMAGNVWEWVEDRYAADYYASAPTTDPRGPSEGDERVQRGGGWTSEDPIDLRSSGRMSMAPDQKVNDVGVRCVWGARGE